MTPDLDAVQRVAHATCAHMHDVAIRNGYIVRPRKDPGSYRGREVFPIIYAAFETGLIKEVEE